MLVINIFITTLLFPLSFFLNFEVICIVKGF